LTKPVNELGERNTEYYKHGMYLLKPQQKRLGDIGFSKPTKFDKKYFCALMKMVWEQ